jgi:hypothetical protein
MPVTYNETLARAAIKTVLDGVTNIGSTHDYERFADDWETLIELYQASIGTDPVVKQLRGWNVSLAGIEPHEQQTFGGPGVAGTVEVSYDYRIRGYLAVDDASSSEKTFVTLTMALVAALDADAALHSSNMEDGANGNFYGPPVSSVRFDFRMFSEVLVHYAELQQILREVV